MKSAIDLLKIIRDQTEEESRFAESPLPDYNPDTAHGRRKRERAQSERLSYRSYDDIYRRLLRRLDTALRELEEIGA